MTTKDGPGVAVPSGERRSSQRVPVEMWVEEFSTDAQVFRRAGNLSLGGLYLDKTIAIPIGTVVQLRFTLPGEDVPLAVQGQVVSIDTDLELGMGIKFLDVTDATCARIATFLDRALAEQA